MAPTRPETTRRIIDWLRQHEGHAHFTEEISQALDIPNGTVGSILSVESEQTLSHNGAGVYGLRRRRSASNRVGVAYSWRSSRPDPADLHTHISRGGKRHSGKRDKSLTLTPHPLVADVWVNGTASYRLVPVNVEVRVEDIT